MTVGIAGHLAAVRRLAGARKRPQRSRIPRQRYPHALEREYASLAIAAAIDRDLGRRLIAAMGGRLDAPSDKFRGAIDDAARRAAESGGVVVKLAADVGRKVAGHNARELGRQLKAKLGIDVPLSDAELAEQIRQFAVENASLIESLAEKVRGELWKLMIRSVTDGMTVSQVTEEIARRYEIGENHARLIARDQIGKLYGKINAVRQKTLGVKRFIWRTVNDQRVRDSHRHREQVSEKRPYSYDDPPGGELPGQPIQCRCHAEPVLDDLLDDAMTSNI